jgi:integrase
MSEITSHDIATRIERIKDAPSERNHALAAAKIFFNWAQKPARRYVLTNPCEGMAPTKRPSRKRVLTDKELVAVYCTATERDDDFSRIVRLLILTGQRRGEVAALEWEWFEKTGCTITLPETVTKNRKDHTFPYGPDVVAILERLAGQSQYLFPANRAIWRKGKRTTVFNSWGKSKAAFDKACGISGWTLHDLRRTFSTNLAGLKVPPHIVERLINHKFGSIQNQTDGLVSAVAEIYNRHLYMDEMREAIIAWGCRLAEIVTQHKSSISEPVAASRDVPRQAPLRAGSHPTLC